MVGTAVDGQLSATRRRSDVRFAVATPADDAAVRRLLRENPMRGSISLTFEREPDYFRGTHIGGAGDETIVAFSGDRVACMGRCTMRDAWVNGRVARVGYLGELRLDHSAQGRFDVLRDGFRFFREQQERNPAKIYFTSIAADNLRARQLLERGLPGMPRYEFLSGLTTLLVSTARRNAGVHALESATASELAAFFNACGARCQFAAAWTPPIITSLASHDLALDSFGVLRERGVIIAAAALWDQRRFRQTVIRGYSKFLTLVRPLLNRVAPLVGVPTLPSPGTVLSHAFLSPLAIAPGREEVLSELVAAFQRRAALRGIGFLTLALPSNDVRLRWLKRRFRCRAYQSRLYQVTWSDASAPALDGRPILPDISLL